MSVVEEHHDALKYLLEGMEAMGGDAPALDKLATVLHVGAHPADSALRWHPSLPINIENAGGMPAWPNTDAEKTALRGHNSDYIFAGALVGAVRRLIYVWPEVRARVHASARSAHDTAVAGHVSRR